MSHKLQLEKDNGDYFFSEVDGDLEFYFQGSEKYNAILNQNFGGNEPANGAAIMVFKFDPPRSDEYTFLIASDSLEVDNIGISL